MLGYDFWQSRYGGSPDVVGRTISVNGQPFEIVGVSARGFNGLDVGRRVDVAALNCATAAVDIPTPRVDVRDYWWLWIVGRLRPGVTSAQANARLAAIARRVNALVLLIACANVAALLLARASSQRREVAVRLALGAGRMRIARQLLVFSTLLSLAGAGAGVLLARWSTPLLVHGISTHTNAVVLDLTPDWRIAAFTTLVALAAGMLFGILPAFRSAKVPLTVTTRGAGAAESHSALRTWIVAGQMALSLVVLVASALLLHSFIDVVRVDPGFDAHNVLLVTVPLWSSDIPIERNEETFDALHAHFAALPGVVAMGRSYHIPLDDRSWNSPVISDAPSAPTGRAAVSYINFISPGYFAAMRMPLLAGRDVTDADGATAPPVAILNRSAALRFFPGIDPVGHTIRTPAANPRRGTPIRIVGVVADAAYRSLKGTKPPTVFLPLKEMPPAAGENTFVIRAAVPPGTLRAAVIAAAADVGRDIPLQFNTLQAYKDDAMVQDRLLAMLSGFFGGVALLLAMVGLYGSVSYRVATRASEFGVRVALGAGAAAIVRIVMREVAVTLGIGVVLGLGLSLAAASTLRSLLHGVGPYDSATIGAAALLLAVVAAFAGFFPARRASRIDPLVVLRTE